MLDAIGNTPLIRINRITREEGVESEILAKCEFFNPGGSVKDRIAVRMVEDAEQSGRIQPGGTIVEPTSGNTGIGLSMVACVKGYKMVVTLPDKMSTEKSDTLKSLGTEVVRVPSAVRFDAPEGDIGEALRIV